MPQKPWWQSKTLWFNALIAVDWAAHELTGHPSLLTQLGVSPQAQAIVLAAANAVLRFTTATKLVDS